MILAVDIGNTNIVIGIYDEEWKHVWRIETYEQQTLLHYSYQINDFIWEAGIDPKNIEQKVLSTVVPNLKPIFIELLEKINKNQVVVLDRNIYDSIDVNINNPFEIGTDLVANALAAIKLYNDNMIVIDFGTALTFTVVDRSGDLVGVNIAPGIKTAINALVDNTAQLPAVPLKFPLNPIGTNTIEAIQNGVLIGYVGMVKYMIKVINSQLGIECKIVATGGLSKIISPHLGEIDFVEPNLTLYGLKFVGDTQKK